MSDFQQEELRFFADVMLGRLARWLRILGYDTCYVHGASEAEIISGASNEGRIILTRNNRLFEQPITAPVVYLASEKPRQQLKQLQASHDIRLRQQKLFSRCSWCNHLLQVLPVRDVEQQIPPWVAARVDSVKRCPVCDKLYWSGTHGDRFIRQLFSEGGE